MQVRLTAPGWGFVPTLALALMCAFVVPAVAQPKKNDKAPSAAPAEKAAPVTKTDPKLPEKKKVQNFDFNAMNLNGNSRTPQLLYFLERANEELERASLEKRSFIPHMVRSVEEEAL
jgi:hypothetical protein